jgi:hypothetical protein
MSCITQWCEMFLGHFPATLWQIRNNVSWHKVDVIQNFWQGILGVTQNLLESEITVGCPVICQAGTGGRQGYSCTHNRWRYMGVGGQRHVPSALPPGKRPNTHCTGGWVGLGAGLDRSGKSRPHRGSNPGPSSLQWVAILTMLSRLQITQVYFNLWCLWLNKNSDILSLSLPSPQTYKKFLQIRQCI